MRADARQRLLRADDNPCLRSAQQLVTAKATDRRPGGDTCGDQGLVHATWSVVVQQVAAAEVLDDRELETLSQRHQIIETWTLCEPLDAEVRRVHAEDEGRTVADRRRVVGRPSLVRRADLPYQRTRLPHDVRDPEAAADLHQLAARYDRLSPLCQCGQHEQHRRSVVVHHHSCRRSRDPRQQPLGVHASRTASASRQVIFEVHIAGRQLCHPARRGLREGGAAQVGVHDHPGRVDDRHERWFESGCKLRCCASLDGCCRLFTVLDRGETGTCQLASQRPGDITQCRQHRDRAVLRLERADGRSLAEPVDGRQDARRGHRPAVRGESPASHRDAPCSMPRSASTRLDEAADRQHSTEDQRSSGGTPSPEGTLHFPDTGHYQCGLAASRKFRIPSRRPRPMSKVSNAAPQTAQTNGWRSIVRLLSLQPRYAGAGYLRRATKGLP